MCQPRLSRINSVDSRRLKKAWHDFLLLIGMWWVSRGEVIKQKYTTIYFSAEAHNIVPRRVQAVDHVVENSNKSSCSQRFIPCKVLIGKEINLNARDSTVHEYHASKINPHKFNLPAPVHYEWTVLRYVMNRPGPWKKGKSGEKIYLHWSNISQCQTGNIRTPFSETRFISKY